MATPLPARPDDQALPSHMLPERETFRPAFHRLLPDPSSKCRIGDLLLQLSGSNEQLAEGRHLPCPIAQTALVDASTLHCPAPGFQLETTLPISPNPPTHPPANILLLLNQNHPP